MSNCTTPDGLEVFNPINDSPIGQPLMVAAHLHNKKVSELEQQVLELNEDLLDSSGSLEIQASKIMTLEKSRDRWEELAKGRTDRAQAWDDAEKLLTEIDDYLSVSKLESIGNGSIFHKEIKSVLAHVKEIG